MALTKVASSYNGRPVYHIAVWNNELYGVTYIFSPSQNGQLIKWNGVDAWALVGTLSGGGVGCFILPTSSKLYIWCSNFGYHTRLYSYDGVSITYEATGTNFVHDYPTTAVELSGEIYAPYSGWWVSSSSGGNLYKPNGVGGFTTVAPSVALGMLIFVLDSEIYGIARTGELYKWNGINAWVLVISSKPTTIPNYVWVEGTTVYANWGSGGAPKGALYSWTKGDASWTAVASAGNIASAQTVFNVIRAGDGKFYVGTYGQSVNGQVYSNDGIGGGWVLEGTTDDPQVRFVAQMGSYVYAVTDGGELWRLPITLPVTDDTARYIVDAGALYMNFGESDEVLMGATRDGTTVVLETEQRDMEADGAKGPTKGARRIVKSRASITANFIELTDEVLERLLAGSVISSYGSPKTHEEIVRLLQLSTADYASNVTLLGEVSGGLSNAIECVIDNPFVDSNFELVTTEAGESVIAATFTGHYDPSRMDEEPWTIRFPEY